MDDNFLGSCRPAIFNFAVVQFFRKKLAVVQFQTRFFSEEKLEITKTKSENFHKYDTIKEKLPISESFHKKSKFSKKTGIS